MRKVLALLFVFVLATGCATHSTSAARHAPEIKRIAIIAATNPRSYSFENATPPVGYPFQFWVNKADSRSKGKIFNDSLNSHPENLGTELTERVAAALRGYGFTVEIMDGLARPADDPDNVDYDKISADADAILHLWISEVGLYSSHTSLDYIPRVNAGAKLFVQGAEENVYNEDIYYGVDARKGKEWAIVPDAKYAYRSFDLVMGNIDEVRSAFSTGVVEISQRMAEQIYRSAKN